MSRHADWMYIRIEKVDETSETARYAFISDVYEDDPVRKGRSILVGSTRGVLSIAKATGSIALVEPMPEDDGKRRFSRASRVITRHWKAGEYPDQTAFASG